MDFGAEKIDLSTVRFTPELLKAIPACTARLYRVLPIFERVLPVSERRIPVFEESVLCIALDDPSNSVLVEELEFVLQRRLELRQADSEQLDTFIQRLYGGHE
jgi:hypothetical protein